MTRERRTSRRYQIVDSNHGKGGFGKVSKERDLFLERFVAVKTIHMTEDKEEREAFEQEARTLARLCHPNIPAIYDVLFAEQSMRIVFEFIGGLPLRDLIENDSLPYVREVCRWFEQIASALEHAHGLGIIHRDVKPENIIITPDQSSAYLVDFGIAVNPETLDQAVESEYILGTEGYMSPEQQDGDAVDISTDLYSLGLTLYETLAGELPELDDYRPLSADSDAVPPALDELIQRCTKEDRRFRMRTAREFRQALRGAFRTDLPFSTLLTGSRLFELLVALEELTAEEFHCKPRGQKLLIFNRLRDLIRTNKVTLERPTAKLIANLVRLASLEPAVDFTPIVGAGFLWGFDKTFGKAVGNKMVRQALIDTCKTATAEAHGVLCERFLTFVDVYVLASKPLWYAHDLRHCVTALLANPHCSDAADELADVYDELNQRTRVR